MRSLLARWRTCHTYVASACLSLGGALVDVGHGDYPGAWKLALVALTGFAGAWHAFKVPPSASPNVEESSA